MDSRYFSLEDWACHSGEPMPPEIIPRVEQVMGMCDLIREAWGGPIVVVSGWRSPAYNQALAEASAKRNGGVSGVAKDSRHVKGDAADIRPVNATAERVERLYRTIRQMLSVGKLPMLGGLALYPGLWVHVDCRQRGPGDRIAKWHGKGIGEST